LSTQNDPPRLPIRLLRWFCPPELYEGIEGDLLEQFADDRRVLDRRKAGRKLMWNVLRFFRPGIILRNRFSFQIFDLIMIRNYIAIAYRNVLKNKTFSAINIFGLSIGLAACLLIIQFVSFELSYDKFHEKFGRIYRVTNDRFQNGELNQHGTITYPTIGPVMAKDYPEIEAYTRIMPGGNLNVRIGEKNYRDDVCLYADDHFLTLFSFPLLAGEKTTALSERFNAVLTEQTARRYFGVTGPDYNEVIGKVFYEGLNPQPLVVKAVCADLPVNSHLQFDILISYSSLISPENRGADDSWTWSDMYHYLLLKPGVDYKALESKFPEFSKRYFNGDKVSGSVEKFYLQPLSDAHLYSDYEYDLAERASGKAVWAMLIVALFILAIAWINYINLTTSRAIDRAKEVGLRKVMGAYRSQLIKQFIFESLLIAMIAFIVAFGFVQVFQSSFNQIVRTDLSFAKVFELVEPSTILWFAVLMTGCALLSGFYPAFVLSSYQPATVLKGKFDRSTRGKFLRKVLVIFQFTASATLITATLVVSRQLSYMNEADLGVQVDRIMVVQAPELMGWDSSFIARVESYKHALSQIDGVVSATTSNQVPASRLGRTFNVRLSSQPVEVRYTMSMMGVDYNFMDTYGVKLLAGRNFLPTDYSARFEDLHALILNRRATQLLGLAKPEDAVGKQILWGNKQLKYWDIIGVVDDYHQESLRNPKEAMVFRPIYSTYNPTSIRLRAQADQGVIAAIESTYKQFFPGNSFEYFFLKDVYSRQYRDDNRFGQVIRIFTVLAIIVSCLGLIGLSSYTATQRTKEIGIRKVMGASLSSIVSLLSVNFLKLVLVAAVLSLPIAYFSMDNWLSGYAYRITPDLLQFILPIAFVLSIAMITISFHVIKAASGNPADTLKHE
jgi:putative ABC transport system permease protein